LQSRLIVQYFNDDICLIKHILLIVATVPFKHHARINKTEARLQQAKQDQQHIKNVCSRLNESNEIKWYQFFVSDRRQYIYCFSPKVACSSWKLTLLRLTGKDLSRITDVHRVEQTNTVLKRLDYYNATERETRLKKYFKFMFVREPLERLVSAYKDKCFREPGSRKHFARFIKIRRRLTNNTDQGEATKR